MASISDFQAAMQVPHLALGDPEARAGRVAVNHFDQPISYAGNNAITYRIDGAKRSLALRCFHRAPTGLDDRYEALTRAVRALRLDRLPWCQFQNEGVYAGGTWNPVVLMPWVSGQLINDALAKNLRRDNVAAIRSGFRDLVADMVAAGISHGDLQHGNLLVGQDNVVRVVDLDTMHTPGMAPLDAPGGHPNYQHPNRQPVLGPRADRFAALVIDLALHALEIMPWLWERFDTGENLLFVKGDLSSPLTSLLIRELSTHPDLHDEVATLVRVLSHDEIEIPSLIRAPGTPDPSHYVCALDRAKLLNAAGTEVAVVGRPYQLVTGRNPRGVRFAFANFGRRSDGAFALKAWADGRGRFPLDVNGLMRLRQGGDGWVIVRGPLSLGRAPGRIKTPEVRVTRASQVSIVTGEQAASMIQGYSDARARATLARQAQDAIDRSVTTRELRARMRDIRAEAARVGLAPPASIANIDLRPMPTWSSQHRAEVDADVLNRLYGESR